MNSLELWTSFRAELAWFWRHRSFSRSAVFGFRRIPPRAFVGAVGFLALAFGCRSAFAAPASTTTTLAVSAGGKTVTAVTANSLVTLTALVSSSAEVKAGFVTFCDSDVDGCAGSGVVGVAQLSGAGTAVLRIYPPIGNHSYKAAFAATTSFAASASSAEELTVAGGTQTAISSSGSTGNYSLTATVLGASNSVLPSGSVSFIDNGNQFSLGAAALGSATTALSLAAGGSAATGIDPDFVAAADFNGDGKLDLAVANDPALVAQTGSGVTILLGNGDGTFTAAPSFYDGSVYGLAVADFNNDGKPDLAISSGTSSITILLGNGDGTFTPAWAAPTGAGPTAITVGDFNRDGNADLAVANNGGDTIAILLGNGDGTFTAGTPISLAANASYIAVADFNEDGKADLAVATVSNEAQVFLGNGDGTFTGGVSLSLSGTVDSAPGDGIAVGDFNGDGNTDLAIESLGMVGSTPAVLVDVFLGKGDGTFTSFTAEMAVGGQTNAYSIAAADFNGDGKTDLLLSDDQEVGIFLSNGDGTFTASATAPGATSSPNWNSVAIGDFNGDGNPDVAVVNSDLQTAAILLTQPSAAASAKLTAVAVPGSGTRNVEAQYPGTTLLGASNSTTIALIGSQLPTSLTLASSLNSAAYGQQLMLTATLTPYLDQSLATDGETVTFLNNGTSIGTGTLSAGVATLNVDSLPSGTDSITATYAGDSNFAPATAKAISLVVAAPAPTATISPGSLTFASQTVGSTSATQTVTLTNSGAAALAISSISASGDFAESQSCGTSLAAETDCTISVTFTPTASGSRTGTLTISDNASGSPQTAALSGTGSSVSITPPSASNGLSISAPGGTATVTLQIGSAGGFSGTVNLTCLVTYTGTGTPNDPPTCSLNPSQETISAGGSANVTLTVNTTAGSIAMLRSLGGGMTLAALAILIFVPRKHRRGLMMLLVVGLVSAMACTACGGSSSGITNSGNPNSGTTAGSYKVAVTATSGGATATATIPFTVQ